MTDCVAFFPKHNTELTSPHVWGEILSSLNTGFNAAFDLRELLVTGSLYRLTGRRRIGTAVMH